MPLLIEYLKANYPESDIFYEIIDKGQALIVDGFDSEEIEHFIALNVKPKKFSLTYLDNCQNVMTYQVEWEEKVKNVNLLPQEGNWSMFMMEEINKILSPQYELRYCLESLGWDHLTFILLAKSDWAELTSIFGEDYLQRFFLKLTSDWRAILNDLQRNYGNE